MSTIREKIDEVFTSSETELLIQSLTFFKNDKEKALADQKASGYTAEDLGVPAVQALIDKLEE